MTTDTMETTDIDTWIENLTDAQLDRLTMRMRRRTNERIAEAAREAALKAARERIPTPTEQLTTFRDRHREIESVVDMKRRVEIFEDGSAITLIDASLCMYGAIDKFEMPTDPLRRVQVMFDFHQTKVAQAKIRHGEVMEDNAKCAQSGGFYAAGERNAAELKRVEAIICESEAAAKRLSQLCDMIHGIQVQHRDDLNTRDRLIADAVSTEPAAARWMSPREGN